jgi:hypothetical protein
VPRDNFINFEVSKPVEKKYANIPIYNDRPVESAKCSDFLLYTVYNNNIMVNGHLCNAGHINIPSIASQITSIKVDGIWTDVTDISGQDIPVDPMGLRNFIFQCDEFTTVPNDTEIFRNAESLSEPFVKGMMRKLVTLNMGKGHRYKQLNDEES